MYLVSAPVLARYTGPIPSTAKEELVERWVARQIRRAEEPEPTLTPEERAAVDRAEADPDPDRARAELDRVARRTNQART